MDPLSCQVRRAVERRDDLAGSDVGVVAVGVSTLTGEHKVLKSKRSGCAEAQTIDEVFKIHRDLLRRGWRLFFFHPGEFQMVELRTRLVDVIVVTATYGFAGLDIKPT